MSEQNVQLVQSAYAAFGRGDIPALLAMLGEDIEWDAVKGSAPEVPTAGPRHGRAGVREFFETLGKSVEFARFEPREFIAQGDRVAVVGYYSGKARPTGASFESDWVMIFTVKNGLITSFQEYADSRALVAAFTPAAARV